MKNGKRFGDDRVTGAAKQKTGRVKELAGQALGDEKLRREGQGEQLEGKAQHFLGELHDRHRKKH